MISSPDRMRADIPARRASPSTKTSRPARARIAAALGRRLLAPLWIVMLCTAPVFAAVASDSLDVDLAALASAAGDIGERPVNFFVDVVSTRLAEEVKLTDKRRVEVGGIPVVLGAERQDGGAAPGVIAGIAGRHDWTLNERWSLQASGAASRAQAIDLAAPASSRAGGELALKFSAGGTQLQLRPSLHAGLQADALHHLDLGLEARLRQSIDDGLALTATAGRGRYDSLELDDDDRDTSFGRLGLDVDLADWSLPRGSDLKLSYEVDRREGSLASQFRLSQHLALLAHLAATEGWRFGGGYSVSATARGYDDQDAEARHRDLRHRLTLESAWDLGGSGGSDWHLSAKYAVERSFAEDRAPTAPLHTAHLSFVFNF